MGSVVRVRPAGFFLGLYAMLQFTRLHDQVLIEVTILCCQGEGNHPPLNLT